MRVAIVHDWLVVYAGAERVLEQMLAVFPEADLFALIDFVPRSERGFLGGRKVRTSWLQHLPFARRHYRRMLPLMPLAVRSLDVSGYDLVISSSHAVARGAVRRPGQAHLCLCYSPMRYAWDLRDQYLRQTGLDRGIRGWMARTVLNRLRRWDIGTARTVHGFIAISEHIARRIQDAYGCDSRVIYPPVDTDYFTPGGTKADSYLTASRLVPYKRVDLIVEAFSAMPDRTLVVIGDGPEMPKIRAKAGSNVRLLGYQPAHELREHLRRARAFIFAAVEDFGIAPLEAQACGTPVIALGRGAATETIVTTGSAPSGALFADQTAEAIVDGVRRFEEQESRITAAACRSNAERFAPERFRREFRRYVETELERIRSVESSSNSAATPSQLLGDDDDGEQTRHQ